MFGWDSYFIILGLLRDGRVDLARGMVENFFYEIENYGAVLNANRTYFLTRSQPPFLSSMIREVYDAELARDPSREPCARKKSGLPAPTPMPSAITTFGSVESIKQVRPAWLATWISAKAPCPISPTTAVTTSTSSNGWSHTLMFTPTTCSRRHNTPPPEEQAKLAQTSCDASHSVVCGLAWLQMDTALHATFTRAIVRCGSRASTLPFASSRSAVPRIITPPYV